MWAIGIMVGKSPFSLASPNPDRNPVITAADITDIDASFVADPFMVQAKGRWYMFFEVLPKNSTIGKIGFATSDDGFTWSYRQTVLSEPFHLSYPHVFEYNGEFYMTPETLDAEAVRLYVAESFPDRWRLIADLIPIRAADPSVFQHNGRWWLFACTARGNDVLRLYHADHLLGAWTEHSRSPILAGDPHRARPAGRVVAFNQHVIRLAQDCWPKYGQCVRAFQIQELTIDSYSEKELFHGPVLGGTGSGWNANRMHHADVHCLAENSWIACVDGR